MIREKMEGLLTTVGNHYKVNGNVVELQGRRDVHLYVLIPGTAMAVHVMGYNNEPSTEERAHVMARLVDYDKVKRLREMLAAATGFEEAAVLEVLPGFQGGKTIPYDPEMLRQELETAYAPLKSMQS